MTGHDDRAGSPSLHSPFPVPVPLSTFVL
jgi:hypothetical protein